MMKKQNKNKKKQSKPIKEASPPQKEKGVDIKDAQTSCKQPNKVIMVLRKTKKIFVNFTSSLWFRIPIIFFIALVIIRIIFMSSPKNASIYFESNDTRTINDITCSYTNFKCNTNIIEIKVKEPIKISFNFGIVNGENIGENFDGGDAYFSGLYITPQFDDAYVTIKEINGNFFDINANTFQNSNIKCSINSYETQGSKTDNKIMMSNDHFNIYGHNDYIVSFHWCDVSLREVWYVNKERKSREMIVDGDAIILYREKQNEDPNYSAGNGLHIYSTNNNILSLSIPLDSLSGRAQFFNVSNTSIQGKGELNFTLPSSISKYDLNLIDLYLKSDDNNLVVTCDFSKDVEDYFKANVNGIVNDAKIANYDLFPTFEGWIANNIFLLPTAIISSVLIPILLDISKGLLKKKKDDDKQEE